MSRMDCEDQETIIFHSYPCAYYVQSPSTVSHANSADIRNTAIELAFHSPTRSETATATFVNKSNNLEASRFALSRYSSSRGSNNSFLHEKKVNDEDGHAAESAENRLVIVDHSHEGDGGGDEEDDALWYYGSGKKGLWWRYFSFRRSNSCAWIFLQISWRLLLSLGFALLVFYMATKPPSPNISVKVLQF